MILKILFVLGKEPERAKLRKQILKKFKKKISINIKKLLYNLKKKKNIILRINKVLEKIRAPLRGYNTPNT